MKKALCTLLALLCMLSAMTGVALAEEPRVLTIGSAAALNEFWNYDVFKKMQEELNMTIEYTYYSGDSFNAMLAGGEMPDIVISRKNIQMLLDNELCMNIAPYLEEYAPEMLNEYYGPYVELSKEMMGGEEKAMYIIMPTVGIHNYMGYSGLTKRGYIVNWEYYKEIGCPEIKNDEDYLNVLYQMWQNHPTADDGTPSYMMGVEGNLGDLSYRACFLKDVAVNQWCPYFYKNDIFTNELVNCYTNTERSNYWYDMAFYNKVYRMGGFDPATFTDTGDEYSAKCDKNTYMGTYYGDTNMATVPSEGALLYNNLLLGLGNCPSYFSFVSRDCDDIDLALAFYNYIYNIDFAREWYSGVEGKDWNYDENGVPSLTAEAMAARAAEDPYWTGEGNGYGLREYYISGYNPAVKGADGYPLDLSFTRESAIACQSELELDICEIYGVEYYYDAYENAGMLDFRNDAGETISATITNVPKDIQRILQSCNDILFSYAPALIMSESDEEFAEIQADVLAELKAVGEEEAWEWYSAAWETPKNIFNEYFAEALPAAGFELYTAEDYE